MLNDHIGSRRRMRLQIKVGERDKGEIDKGEIKIYIELLSDCVSI